MVGEITNSYGMNPVSYYPNTASASSATVPGSPVPVNASSVSTEGKDATKQSGAVERTKSSGECQTCRERKYQDGSNEAVSFKSAAHIAPEAAASTVRAHEGEHVSNAFSKASQGNGKVVSASVSLHTAVCPECGRTYVSGGTTRTTIRYNNESNPYQQNKKSADSLATSGANIDYAI